MQQLFT